MAERLDNIAYQQQSATGAHHPNFNPRSVSVDIRTPEELAAVNEFLITLGRDVSTGRQQSSSSPHPNSFPSDPYFDAANLSQLGLTGMPGLPGSNTNFSENPYPQYSNNGAGNYHSSRSTHASVQPNQYNTMYSGINEQPMGYNPNDYNTGRRKYSSPNSSFSNQHYHHPTPPLESGSPHSTVSTPVTTTPPQVPMSMPDTFDYLRPSRGAPTIAHLAPPEYNIGKTMRPMIPLKSLPSAGPSHPLPVEPKLPLALHRKAAPSTTTLSRPGSLYPSLVTGDIQFKLPPLNKMYRSPSPPSPSRESTPSSSAHSSPRAQPTTLPGISSIAVSPDSEDLTHDIGRIEIDRTQHPISQDERKRHAEFILNLLVSINNDFKNRFSNETRDVEMATV